ncbi:hypothetical protein RND71_003675 [Anisodus tanguticus]|uniref:Uncharacterized protein n=1 Tax=Anisodus tanguticus TaxID=243964 RepID=A0AAE1VWU9_9SOLA|nr:hypothetical protein RND71_003675 [Anisodus tanguticus]
MEKKGKHDRAPGHKNAQARQSRWKGCVIRARSRSDMSCHSVSSAYENNVSNEHNSNSEWDEYPNCDWNESEVRQPPQGENSILEDLMYKFIIGVEERFIQNDAAIENLTTLVSQLISIMSENLLHCDGKYMEETPRENEPTRDYEHLERDVATLQEDFDSAEIVEDKFLIDCESMEKELIPLSNILQLKYIPKENEERLVLYVPKEYPYDHFFCNLILTLTLWILLLEIFRKCRNKLRIILHE